MSITLEWHEIALRSALTLVAGGLFGINRSEHGRPAGLRTTMLVCLAASVAMIQTNLLLTTAGKTPDSFGVMDLMRLPLGILTGMGFIGAGAIVRRHDLVLGVTTAATLWFVTVVGLCFGGGQVGLGVASTGIGLVVLWVLKWLERFVQQERRATLIVRAGADSPTEDELRAMLLAKGYTLASWGVLYGSGDHSQRRRFRCEVHWRSRESSFQAPAFVEQVARLPGVAMVMWKTQ